MATIKDVAKKAGVSPSTVSRTLKDNPAISEETKVKVRAAMEELGYVPNSAAQMLATGLTHSLGVVLPPLTDRENISQPFYMEILTAINEEASLHRQKRADGFIILYSEKKDPVKDYLLKAKVPFVVVGAAVDNENKVTYIDNDNKELGRDAVNYLQAKGHRKIGFVTDDLFGQVGQERYQGYMEAADEQNLDVLPELVFSARTIEDLKKELEGFRVPEDYAIISFNNSTFAEIMHPFLTTFDINIQALARESVQSLLGLLKAAKIKSQKVIIPFELIERESVLTYP